MTKNGQLIRKLLSKGHPEKCYYCIKKLNPTARHPDATHMTLEHLCPPTCHKSNTINENNRAIPDNRLANLAIACKDCNNGKVSNCKKDCMLDSTILVQLSTTTPTTEPSKRSATILTPPLQSTTTSFIPSDPSNQTKTFTYMEPKIYISKTTSTTII